MGPTEVIFPRAVPLAVVGCLCVRCLHREVVPTVAKAERALEARGGHWELGGCCCCTPDVLTPFFCETILAVSFGESHLNAQLFFRGHATTVIGSGMGT